MVCSKVQECIKNFSCFLLSQENNQGVKGKRYRVKKNSKAKTEVLNSACNDRNNQDKCIMFFDCRSKANCKEKGKSYTFDQSACRKKFPIIGLHVDGGIVDDKDCNKCDYAYILLDSIDRGKGRVIFVELKGGNVKHAIQQLESTISMDIFSNLSQEYKKIYARIVSSSVPKIRDGAYVELQKKMKRLGGNLKIKEVDFIERYDQLDIIPN